MNKTTSIIEINGNRYDAVSGRLIGAVKKAAYQAIKPTSGLSIDGFTRRRTAKATIQTRQSGHELKRHPEHSKTLMRAGLKKPTKAESKNNNIEFRGLSVDHARADRARRVPQNSKVQRFGLPTFSHSLKAKTGEVEVIAPKPNSSTRSAMVATATLPSVMTNASHYKLERLLDYALAHADAHKKSLDASTHAHRKFFGRLPRWLVISLITVVLGLVIGFVVWHRMPGASFKLAATMAHVNSNIPTPISGYKVGPISSTQSTVTITIQSASDSSKKYTVTEKASNQPYASLAANAANGASGNAAQVQTVQDHDKTYVLSQDNNKSTAACTKGTNTVSVETIDLNIAQLLDAAKNACKN